MSEPDIVPIPPSPWVTAAEAAAILRVPVERVQSLVKMRRFKLSLGPGLKVLISRADVEAAARRGQK